MLGELPSNWKWMRFEDLLNQPLRNGIYKKKEFHGSGCKIVNMGELFSNPRIQCGLQMKRVELTEKEIDKSTLQEGDLIFARRSLTAEGAGKCCVILSLDEPTTFESSIIRARLNQEIANPEFYYYLFNSPFGKWLLGTILRQVAVAGITGGDLAKLEVPVPPKIIQDKLAEYGRVLDDKIELNRQINATLEFMAQALFKSWFVDFDPVIDNALAAGNPIPEPFQARAEKRAALLAAASAADTRSASATDNAHPTQTAPHTQTGTTAPATPLQPLPADLRALFPDSFVFNEEMGWVPEGWEVSTIGEQVETTGGGTPSTKNPEFWEGGIYPFCTPKDMSQLSSWVLKCTERHLTPQGVGNISSGQLPAGAVLMSSRAPIGYLAISDMPVSVNQGIIAMLPSKIYSPMFLLNWASFSMDRVNDRANGSTFLEISKKNFKPIPFLVPNNQAINLFNEKAELMLAKIRLVADQISVLSEIRDSLLPKLLSGQIQLPEVERKYAEAAQ